MYAKKNDKKEEGDTFKCRKRKKKKKKKEQIDGEKLSERKTNWGKREEIIGGIQEKKDCPERG